MNQKPKTSGKTAKTEAFAPQKLGSGPVSSDARKDEKSRILIEFPEDATEASVPQLSDEHVESHDDDLNDVPMFDSNLVQLMMNGLGKPPTIDELIASGGVIKTSFSLEDDLDSPKLSGENISDNYCTHSRGLQKCACMSVFKLESGKYDMTGVLFRDLELLRQEVPICQLFNYREELYDYMNHFTVIFILTTQDKKLVGPTHLSREDFIRKVYSLRSLIGDFSDHGQKHLVMAGQQEEEQSSGLISLLSSLVKSAAKGLTNLVAKTCDTMASWIKTVFGFISSRFASIIENLMKSIAGYIVDMFGPLKFLKDLDEKTAFLVVAATMMVVVVFVDVLGIVTYKLTTRFIESLCREKQIPMHAQSMTPGPLGGFISLVGVILGLSAFDMKTVSDKARQLNSILVAGFGTSAFLCSLFLCLPTVLQSALTMKFGSSEEKEKVVTDKWLTRAQALIQLAAIPKILVTDEFYEWVKDCIREANGMRRTIKTPVIANLFMRNLVSLTKLAAMLRNLKDDKSFRSYPFSLHVWGAPGTGKTFVASKLLRDVTDLSESTIFTRPVSSEYWDGFQGQEIVMIDEFLIGKGENVLKMAKEYLELVSTKSFQPPLASLNDAAVGIKGTTCSPKVVLTINNDEETRIDGIPHEALTRRRHFVIEMVFNPDFKDRASGNYVDLKSMTDEEVRNLDWLRFNVKSPTVQGPSFDGLSYNALIVVMRDEYAQHNETCERVRQGLHGNIQLTKTPVEMLEDVMREINGVPNEPISIMEALGTIFVDAKNSFLGMMHAQAGETPKTMDEEGDRRKLKESIRNLRNTQRRMRATDSMEKREKLKAYVKKNEANIEMLRKKLAMSRKESQEIDQLLTGDSETDYYDADSLSQKDMIAKMDHSDVDATLLHRHKCGACKSQFAHKHDQDYFHDFLCPACVRANKQSRCYTFLETPFSTAQKKKYDTDGFNFKSYYPQEDFESYPDLSEEYKSEVRRFLRDQALKKFLNLGSLPIFDTIFEEQSWSPWDVLKNKVVTTAKWTGIAIGVWTLFLGVKKLLGGSKSSDEEFVCFSSQSTSWPSNKVSRSRVYSVKMRSGRMHAQASAPGIIHLTVDKPGSTATCYAFPIAGRVFVTVNHIFETIDGLIPDGTILTLKYGGSVIKLPFSADNLTFGVDSDVAFYNTGPTKLNMFPDLRKKFWTEDQAANFKVGTVSFNTEEGTKMSCATKLERVKYSVDGLKTTKILEHGLVYRMKMQNGDCGLAVSSLGSIASGMYMGIHVAGGQTICETQGAAVIITREMIEEALKLPTIDDVIELKAQSGELNGPNLLVLEQVPVDEQVYVNRKSKLQPSSIVKHLPWKPLKHRPIMSTFDERSNGVDPAINMLNDTLSVVQPEVDRKVFSKVKKEMFDWWHRKLEWTVERRQLTFEEALGGIPGKLASYKSSTSAGYPLCKIAKKKGKQDFFHFDKNGDLVYEDYFAEMVADREVELIQEDEDSRDRFLVYMKDEPVTQKKIDEGRTRLIYSGNLLSNVVFRQYFGSLLASMNASYHYSPSAVGLNPYSWDMDVMYEYLMEVQKDGKFVAGDFKNFDKNMIRQFQEAAYELLMDLMGEVVPKEMKQAFVKNQMDPYVQYSQWKFRLKTSHLSGCFFTTIVNNLVHEMYLRYIFMRQYPDLSFSKHVRSKILGDDHIYSFSEECRELNPVRIAELLAEIGQTYTSDKKDQPLTEEFRSFEDITFLGAHPVMLEGYWCGALKKETIQESTCWTRNKNETLCEEMKSMIEFASMWELDYFDHVQDSLRDAWLHSEGYEYPYDLLYHETRAEVARRTAASGLDFFGYLTAQTLEQEDLIPLFAQSKTTLVDLGTGNQVDSDQLGSTMNQGFSNRAIGQLPATLDFGTESPVFRQTFPWSTAQAAGTVLGTWAAPFGILGEGEQNNLQNMAFDRYNFWNGDVCLVFQINGTPFQQGLLAVYFVPLGDYEFELANITAAQHVFVQPNNNTTATIRVPFRYYRSLLNTLARGTESIGTFKAVVYSPLAAADPTTVSVTMLSAFPDSKFHVPRPLYVGRTRFYYHALRGNHVNGVMRNSGIRKKRDADEEVEEQIKMVAQMIEKQIPMIGHGASQSTTINNNYSNVGGNMPISDISNVPTAQLDQTQDISPQVDVSMPLDNPPLASGGLPVQQTFTGMSTSYGIRPTNDMQLYPAALSREQMQIFDPAEAKVETILGKMTLLRAFMVNATDPAGKQLYKIQMNTRMGLAEGDGIPLNVALLNQFMFWRGDIEFTFIAVKTRYHSMRIQALIGYGAEEVASGSRTTLFSKIMKFSEEEDVHSFTVDWNAQTEFLRTYEGDGQFDPVQNYSLGVLAVYLQNILVAPETVAQSVEVLVGVRFLNPKVAVPRGVSPFTFGGEGEYVTTVYVVKMNSKRPCSHVGKDYTMTKTDMAMTGSPADGVYQGLGTIFFDFTPSTGGVYALSFEKNQMSLLSGIWTWKSDDFTGNDDGEAQIGSGGNQTKWQFVRPLTAAEKAVHPTTVKIPVTSQVPMSAQSLEVQEEQSAPAEELLHQEENMVTDGQVPERPSIPCKLEIGKKFEFTITDLHEVGRRYVAFQPDTEASEQGFNVLSRTLTPQRTTVFQNFSVSIYSPFKHLFAAWAGSVKFRIFQKAGSSNSIIFAPFYNQSATEPCVPVIDSLGDSSFVYEDQSLATGSAIAGNYAREKFFPTSDNVAYVDVSAPFQSHFNFCLTTNTQEVGPISSGTMAVATQDDDEPPQMYTAFGDDLRLGIFRPPQTTRFDMSGFTKGIGGYKSL